jgi:excisionase family DNA binding protein
MVALGAHSSTCDNGHMESSFLKAREPSPFTPRTLAERWACSERHVRNLINRGDLRAFRLGGKLVRILLASVEEFERCQCQSSESSPSEESSPSNGMRMADVSAGHSAQPFVVTFSPRCDDLSPSLKRSGDRAA